MSILPRGCTPPLPLCPASVCVHTHKAHLVKSPPSPHLLRLATVINRLDCAALLCVMRCAVRDAILIKTTLLTAALHLTSVVTSLEPPHLFRLVAATAHAREPRWQSSAQSMC